MTQEETMALIDEWLDACGGGRVSDEEMAEAQARWAAEEAERKARRARVIGTVYHPGWTGYGVRYPVFGE